MDLGFGEGEKKASSPSLSSEEEDADECFDGGRSLAECLGAIPDRGDDDDDDQIRLGFLFVGSSFSQFCVELSGE